MTRPHGLLVAAALLLTLAGGLFVLELRLPPALLVLLVAQRWPVASPWC
jgi:hypothetical protein